MRAYWSGLFLTIVDMTIPNDKPEEQNAAGLLALSVLGAGSMFGSLLIGLIVDKIGNKTAVCINIITILLCWICTFEMIKHSKTGPLVYIFAFSWGLMDGAITTHVA